MFSQFGKIVDVVALKTLRLRGQAWIVFSDVAAATNAKNTMQGFPFFDKPIVSGTKCMGKCGYPGRLPGGAQAPQPATAALVLQHVHVSFLGAIAVNCRSTPGTVQVVYAGCAGQVIRRISFQQRLLLLLYHSASK